MSIYTLSINLTTQTINNRARHFRNQIVVVVIVGLCSIGGAAATRTLWPLAGLLFLFPICGLFSLLDAKLLNDWRANLLATWVTREFDFWAFREAMGAIATLPKATLLGMLTTLPSTPNWGMERATSGATCAAVAEVVTVLHAYHADAITVKALGSAIAAVAFVFAIALEDGRPLLLTAAILLLPLLSRCVEGRRLAKLKALIAAARRGPDFDPGAFEGLIHPLDWRALSTDQRNGLATVVCVPAPPADV